MKVIVAGTRHFSNYNFLKSKLDYYFSLTNENIEIVSGKAKGADTLGEKYAIENNLTIKEFPANWNEHGKKAGYIRNEEMAIYADCCIVFWDGKSKGTESMIKLAKKYKLNLKVVRYEINFNTLGNYKNYTSNYLFRDLN